jgi:hypothetical protein
MTDLELYIKLSNLPLDLKNDVSDYIEFIKYKLEKKSLKKEKRIAGQAKGLISMKDNFEDPIEGFKEYM